MYVILIYINIYQGGLPPAAHGAQQVLLGDPRQHQRELRSRPHQRL